MGTYKSKAIPSGTKMGYWIVIKQVPRPEGKKGLGRYYLCRCICGKEKIIDGKNLREGRSKSCGCKRTALIGKKTKSNRIPVICPMCGKTYTSPINWTGNGTPRKMCASCKGYVERGTDPDLNDIFDSDGNFKYSLENIPADEFVVSYG